jgi:hypothetical protein
MEAAEHHDNKSPMELTIEALQPSKSKDQVTVRRDPDTSEARSAHAERPIHCYDARNETKGSEYKVELIDAANGKPYGWCNCAASVVCKHIKIALYDLLATGSAFGEATWGDLFMDCKQGNHPECLVQWGGVLACSCTCHIPKLRAAAAAALNMLTGSDREYALVDVSRPGYTICDMLREALGHPPQDRSDW